MQGLLKKRRCRVERLIPFCAIALLLAGSLFFVPQKTLAYSQAEQASCSAAGTVTDQSLLIVLLDRSGSLTYQPGATDPDGYSTSVTRALADLWPGSMAVIPFSNDATPVIGPATLSDASQRDSLKQAVENYPIGGDTPLAPAMHKALELLKNAPAGSRVVIVTDGEPDPAVLNGVNQSDDIHHNLIPQFCAQGIPVSAFGLALDLTTPAGQAADHLLRDIATGTGATYNNVRNARELAHVVIQLYASWRQLVFVPANNTGGNYMMPIDTYAKKVSFVTFRSNSSYAITLKGPDGQPIPDQALTRSTDRHYEIDNLVVSDVNQPGPYTITAGNDPQAQAYALVETRLHAVLLQPTAQTVAHIGQPIGIQAELQADNTPIIPKANEATMNAQVTLLVNGQTASTQSVELAQVPNSPVFAGKITLAGPAGDVHMQIEAVYLQIPVEASEAQVTFPLQKAVTTKQVVYSPPAQPGCGIDVSCYWRHNPVAVLALSSGGLLLLLLLTLLLVGLLRESPVGQLIQGKHIEDLSSMSRSLSRRLFHKSVVSSRELEDNGFNFCGADFDLIFRKGTWIKARSDVPEIIVRHGRTEQVVSKNNQAPLASNDVIAVEQCSQATYK